MFGVKSKIKILTSKTKSNGFKPALSALLSFSTCSKNCKAGASGVGWKLASLASEAEKQDVILRASKLDISVRLVWLTFCTTQHKAKAFFATLQDNHTRRVHGIIGNQIEKGFAFDQDRITCRIVWWQNKTKKRGPCRRHVQYGKLRWKAITIWILNFLDAIRRKPAFIARCQIFAFPEALFANAEDFQYVAFFHVQFTHLYWLVAFDAEKLTIRHWLIEPFAWIDVFDCRRTGRPIEPVVVQWRYWVRTVCQRWWWVTVRLGLAQWQRQCRLHGFQCAIIIIIITVLPVHGHLVVDQFRYRLGSNRCNLLLAACRMLRVHCWLVAADGIVYRTQMGHRRRIRWHLRQAIHCRIEILVHCVCCWIVVDYVDATPFQVQLRSFTYWHLKWCE